MSNLKKYSTFSIVLYVVGSCVGAGIFFKNAEIESNTDGNLYLALISWIAALLVLIFVGLALAYMLSNSKGSNKLSYVSWIKRFTNYKLYKGFINFTVFFLLPMTIWFLAYYATMALQDAIHVFNYNIILNWWEVSLISLGLTFFFTISVFSTKNLGMIQNHILTYIKIIPILLTVIFGFIAYKHGIHVDPSPQRTSPTELSHVWICFGIIACFPAIFFTMDGFYNGAAVSDRMKNPNNIGKAIVLGLIVTSIIYMLIGISTGLGAYDGTVTGIFDRLVLVKNIKIFYFITMLGIFLAVVSILNSFTMLGKEILYELANKKELKIEKLLNSKNEFINSLKVSFLLLIIFVIVTVLGCFYYTSNSYFGTPEYDSISCKIYSLCDELSDITTLIVFLGIILCILFYFIQNKKVTKLFKFYALIGIIFFSLSYLFEASRIIFNLIETSIFSIKNKTNFVTYVLPAIIDFFLTVAMIILCFYPYKTPNNYNLHSKL